jgi:hypothetical protein
VQIHAALLVALGDLSRQASGSELVNSMGCSLLLAWLYALLVRLLVMPHDESVIDTIT